MSNVASTLLRVSATMSKRNFVLSTKSKRTEHVQFVPTLSNGRNFTINCSTLLPFVATKSNVAWTLLLVWTGLYSTIHLLTRGTMLRRLGLRSAHCSTSSAVTEHQIPVVYYVLSVLYPDFSGSRLTGTRRTQHRCSAVAYRRETLRDNGDIKNFH